MEEEKREFDLSGLLYSLKKVIETDDRNRVDLLKNGLTKILFRDAVSFETIAGVKKDLEEIFKTAEDFVASLLSEETIGEAEEIILEAPEEFRNETTTQTRDTRTGTDDVILFEPRRSTYREADNDRPEVPLLSEEVPCENSRQTFSKSERENNDKLEDKPSNYIPFNTALIYEDNDQTNRGDKIKFPIDSGSDTSIVNTQVGVVVKPEFSIHSRPCVSILNTTTTNVTVVTGVIRQNISDRSASVVSDFNTKCVESSDLNVSVVQINEEMAQKGNENVYELPPELPVYLRRLKNEDTDEDDQILNVRSFNKPKNVGVTLPPPLITEETELMLPDFLLKSSKREETMDLPQLPDKSLLDLISLRIDNLKYEENARAINSFQTITEENPDATLEFLQPHSESNVHNESRGNTFEEKQTNQGELHPTRNLQINSVENEHAGVTDLWSLNCSKLDKLLKPTVENPNLNSTRFEETLDVNIFGTNKNGPLENINKTEKVIKLNIKDTTKLEDEKKIDLHSPLPVENFINNTINKTNENISLETTTNRNDHLSLENKFSSNSSFSPSKKIDTIAEKININSSIKNKPEINSHLCNIAKFSNFEDSETRLLEEDQNKNVFYTTEALQNNNIGAVRNLDDLNNEISSHLEEILILDDNLHNADSLNSKNFEEIFGEHCLIDKNGQENLRSTDFELDLNEDKKRTNPIDKKLLNQLVEKEVENSKINEDISIFSVNEISKEETLEHDSMVTSLKFEEGKKGINTIDEFSCGRTNDKNLLNQLAEKEVENSCNSSVNEVSKEETLEHDSMATSLRFEEMCNEPERNANNQNLLDKNTDVNSFEFEERSPDKEINPLKFHEEVIGVSTENNVQYKGASLRNGTIFVKDGLYDIEGNIIYLNRIFVKPEEIVVVDRRLEEETRRCESNSENSEEKSSKLLQDSLEDSSRVCTGIYDNPSMDFYDANHANNGFGLDFQVLEEEKIEKLERITEESAEDEPDYSTSVKEEILVGTPREEMCNKNDSSKIYDLPIIGNNNYPNLLKYQTDQIESPTKLDELLKLPRLSAKRNSRKGVGPLIANATQIVQTSVGYPRKVKVVDESAKVDHVTLRTSNNLEENNGIVWENEECLNGRQGIDDGLQEVTWNEIGNDEISAGELQRDSEDIEDLDDSQKSIEDLEIHLNLDDTISKLNMEMQKSAEIDESLQSEAKFPEENGGEGNRGLQRVADGWKHVGAPRREMVTSSDGNDACACQEGSIVVPSPAGCAHASQCSRCPAARTCTTLAGGLRREKVPIGSESNEESGALKSATEENLAGKPNLTWAFKNGRLVFEDCEETDGPSILKSKNVNPKNQEGGRLKILEEKLKEAGITDGKQEENAKEIGNSSSSSSSEEDFLPSDSEEVNFCEFSSNDLQQINETQRPLFFYHDLDDENDIENLEVGEEIFVMRGDNGQTHNPERKLHNPDRENLKSLLKKPGRNKEQPKKNRVVFNETKNEFFDADYIILIREECEYDDEEDDGVCTCNQHEMVRLTCCEPNCNCNVYDGYDPTPQSPKFAPPLEFVDAVTLSPPEEYKDMELEEQQLIALQQQMVRRGQRGAVCRECSASHEEEGEGSLSENDDGAETPSDDQREAEEKEKTDQSQQTTPTTPPADSGSNDEGQRYILETLTMTMVSERQIMRDADDKPQSPTPTPSVPPGGSPISGILKGGRLWKQASNEINTSNSNSGRTQDLQQSESITSDDEGMNKRSVRFIETKEHPTPKQRDVCDGAPDVSMQEEVSLQQKLENKEENISKETNQNAESTEMMLTFKLGNHVLISNNSLKPNSAVRQLFPCTKPLGKTEEDPANNQQYLVTAESLKAFEEAKRSKLPQIIQSGDTDESIRRAIERNTLRRSLIRGDPKNKKVAQKTDNSLVERIKQLTCDVDDDMNVNQEELQQQRASPPGEEARNSPEVNVSKATNHDKSFSPSSSSTASSNSSSMSSTYRKITDLFSKRDKPDIQNVDAKLHLSAPDLGNGPQEFVQEPSLKINTTESRKQFLSTLVPLTACVSGIGLNEDYYHINSGHNGGDRSSMASSVGTEYSLEDIDEVLKKDEEEGKKIAPDVLAGTPSASESGDELAMFVQQDAGRIERIKKKYQPEATEEDDEHDDYGFNRRPSVRGIKPRFGSTTEILQQIQNQMQPPNNTPPRSQVVWPYYSETNLTSTADVKRNPPPINHNHPPINQNHPPINQNHPAINQNLSPYPASYQINPNQTNEDKRTYVQYSRPTSYIEENLYQNCTNQRCTQINYRNMNVVYPSVVRVGGGCSEYYNSTLSRRNNRPLSPPPQEVSKNYHQTMVYIPYNHIEGYHNYYAGVKDCYTRVSNQNQINKRYIEAYRVEDHYSKPVLRQQVYARSESPQFSTARSTQTPSIPNCYIYPNPNTSTVPPPANRYSRSMVPPPNGVLPVWSNNQEGGVYPKINRHSYPRYPPSDSLSLTDSDSQHSKNSMPNSPTKNSRFIERGVPEGAASVSPQDGQTQNNSTMTSPTSPQNPQGPKPMFYAMNV